MRKKYHKKERFKAIKIENIEKENFTKKIYIHIYCFTARK